MLLNNNNIQRWIGSCVVITALLLALSCGGGGGTDPQPGTGNGKVALFITDNISFYKQVVATITGIRLVNSGTGGIFEVLGTPVTLDIANLTNMAQYVNLAQCPAGHYNRIDIEFRRSVHLMNQLNETSACSFTSFIHESGERRSLACNPDTGICTLSVKGGDRDGSVLVQEDRYNDLGIDFDVKKFTVADFGNQSACSVTMTAYPVSATDMNSSGRAHSVTGGITDLDVAADTFVLSAGTTTLTVDYSGILPSLQPNIDKLLVTAIKGGLGHTLGASGAMAAVAAIYALQAGLIPPTLNLDALDGDCGALQVVTGGPRRLGGGRVMVNAFGLGHNASVIFSRP